MSLCPKCSTYAVNSMVSHEAVIILGHHPHCEDYRNPDGLVAALCREFRDAIEAWAADEDGVHDAAWNVYCKAKAILGESITEGGS